MNKRNVMLNGMDEDEWKRFLAMVRAKWGTVKGHVVEEVAKALEAYRRGELSAGKEIVGSNPVSKPALSRQRVDVQRRMAAIRAVFASEFQPASGQPEWIRVSGTALHALLAQGRLKALRSRSRYIQRMLDFRYLRLDPENMNVFYLSRAWLYPKAERVYPES